MLNIPTAHAHTAVADDTAILFCASPYGRSMHVPPAGRLVLWHFPTLPSLRFCHIFCLATTIQSITQKNSKTNRQHTQIQKARKPQKEPILIHSKCYAHSVRHFFDVVLKTLLFPFVFHPTRFALLFFFSVPQAINSQTKNPPKPQHTQSNAIKPIAVAFHAFLFMLLTTVVPAEPPAGR